MSDVFGGKNCLQDIYILFTMRNVFLWYIKDRNGWDTVWIIDTLMFGMAGKLFA